MAAPVGHIICALAFLNSGTVDIADKNAFLVGTSFPDIRYITGIHRSTTHKIDGKGLAQVSRAPNPVEAGRIYHVIVDEEREKHMRKYGAYRFIQNGPLKTQMLKIIEDQILLEKLKGKFDAHEVFDKIYDEELAYSIKESEIRTWHNLLTTYLDQTHWFNIYRYYKTLIEFQKAYGLPSRFFGNFWQNMKTLGFFIYAYCQLQVLSRNQELRKIILDFYENKIEEIIRLHRSKMQDQTVKRHGLDPPPIIKGFS